MVGICLVLHLDGRHRPTVGMAYNTLPLMFERPLLPRRGRWCCHGR
jgi:hypothetical protein